MKLTLLEVSILFVELNGKIVNQETKERSGGVFSNKLSIRTKHVLKHQLNDKLAEEIKALDASVLELFKELGEVKDNQYFIPAHNRVEFLKKEQELNSIDMEIPVPNINIEELFNVETDEYWNILLDKLLKPVEIVGEATVVEEE
jgi:hypothetical protein